MNRATKRLVACLTFTGIIALGGCDSGFVVDPLGTPGDPAFSLSPSEMTLAVGENAKISATLVRANGEAVNPQALKWESTDPSRASVDRDGVVTGHAPGTPAIVASSGKMADTTWIRIVEQSAPRAGVNISPDSVVLRWLDATATLSAEVLDEDGTLVAAPGLTWKSLNPGIAQTDGMGVITAKGVGVALIVATAGCCERADTAYARIHQVVYEVAIEQESVTLSQGSSVQLQPVALDRGGATIEDVTFAFKSANESVAKVSSSGVVMSQSAGTTTVTATSGDHIDQVTVTVTGSTAAPAPGQRPNEPAGFVPWFVHDWQTFPSDRDTCTVPASHRGFFVFCGVSAHVDRGTLINDPNAPHGFGKSIRVHWPANFPGGSGFFNYAIRSTDVLSPTEDRIAASTPLQKWYISTWVYLEPDANGEWEMNFNQLRHFTGNRHITGLGRASVFGWTLRGDAISGSSMDYTRTGDAMRDYRLWGYSSPGGTSTTFATAAPGLPVGKWVHMELLFDRTVKGSRLFDESNAGIGPVRVKYWANGQLIMDRLVEDVWMSHPFMELFFNLNQSSGDRPTTDKYIRLSGTYVSGELYDGR